MFRDLLEVSDAEILYRYGDMFYDSYAAVTRKKQGKGTVYYLGCGLDAQTADGLLETVINACGIPSERTESGVEVCVRGEGDNRVRMIMNHNGHTAHYRDTTLAPYESRIEKI